MEEEAVKILVAVQNAIELAAPAVWGAAVKEAAVQGYISLLWGCLLLCVTVAAVRVIARTDFSDDEGAKFGAGVVIVVCAFSTLGMMSSAIRHLTNPEWAAISLVKGLF